MNIYKILHTAHNWMDVGSEYSDLKVLLVSGANHFLGSGRISATRRLFGDLQLRTRTLIYSGVINMILTTKHKYFSDCC